MARTRSSFPPGNVSMRTLRKREQRGIDGPASKNMKVIKKKKKGDFVICHKKNKQVKNDIMCTCRTRPDTPECDLTSVPLRQKSLPVLHAANSTTSSSPDRMEKDSESSGDDLPAIFDVQPAAIRKVKTYEPGMLVWAKSRGWPHWPAVIRRVSTDHKKASVTYLSRDNERVPVSLRSTVPFTAPSRHKFIESGKSSRFKEEFVESIDKADDYLIKRGLGKSFCGSSADLSFGSDPLSISAMSPLRQAMSHDTPGDTSPDTSSCDRSCMSHDMSREMSRNMPLTLYGASRGSSPDISHDTPHDGDFCAAFSSTPLTAHPASLSSDEELQVGYPIIKSNACYANEAVTKEDVSLTKRKESWLFTQSRLLTYIKRETTKKHLLAIYKGSTKCERQKLYESGRILDKHRLRSMAGVGPFTDDKLTGILTDYLKDLYVDHCMQSLEDFPNMTYITEVWLPEAIVFAIQKTRRVNRKKAEELFVKEGSQSLLDLGEDVVPSSMQL